MTNSDDPADWPVAVRTDVGRVRDGNEDACVATGRVWLVADGLGGHAGGEVASEAAVRAATAEISARAADGEPHLVLDAAFAAAHRAVRDRGHAHGLSAMGTTLVAAYADPAGRVWVGSLGDSRAYLLSGDGLRQLTTDDNYAADLVAAGVITEEEARTHPGQYMLTQALIADDERTYPPQVVPVNGSGRLLLCSDGLNAELTDREIASLLGTGDVAVAADALVRAALDAGGSDNVTVVCVDLG